jgi:hypothetical protein
MRKCLALFCVLSLFVSPLLFACLDAEPLLTCPESWYRLFLARLPLVMIVFSSIMTLALPWIIVCFTEDAPE